MWEKLSLVRVYTKPKGRLPDYNEPVVLRSKPTAGSDGIVQKLPTIEDFCNSIHKGLMKDFKHAMVWGRSVKHSPQKVGKDHELQDEDVVQIIKKI